MIRQLCSTRSWRVNLLVSPTRAACSSTSYGVGALASHLGELDVEQDRRRGARVRAMGVEDDAHARRRVELDHELVSARAYVECREGQPRRVFEDEPHPSVCVTGQALSRANEERDSAHRQLSMSRRSAV
jgi:hypothetical protein